MTERKDEKMVEDGFREYLSNRGLKETSVEDDTVRIKMMTSRYIDYTKGEDYARELLHKCDLSNSSVVSCLRVCRYYKEYLDQRNN